MPDDMNIERDTGTPPPYAQRDVDNAINRAMSAQERQARIAAGLPIPGMAGGSEDAGILGRRSGEQERGSRELDKNIETIIRSRAQAEYDPTLEVVKKHRNIYAIRSVIMAEVAGQMRTLDEFDEYRLRQLKQALRGSGRSLTIPDEKLGKYSLDKYGFGGTPERVREAIELRIALLEAEAFYFEQQADNEAEKKPDLANKYRREAKNYGDAARLEREIHEDELVDFPRDEQRRLGQGKEMLAEAIRILEKINTAYFLYNKAAGDMPTLVQLFIDGRYAGITSRELQTLFSLPRTEKEETYSFGKKIDMAMRLYALIGIGGGKDGEKDINNTIDKIRKNDPTGNWIDKLLTPEDIKFLTGKNLFCDGPGQSKTELVKQWIREKIGGDPTDTELAEGIAWKLFYMWGLAPQFDGKAIEKGIKESVDKQYPLPSGTPDTDDTIKVYHYNSFLYKDAWRGRPHGPDATLGKYPEQMLVSFLHSLKTGKGENTRSFWEKWLYEGIDLGNLPWAKLGEEPGAQMIEEAMDNIVVQNKDRQSAVEEAEKILKEARASGDEKKADEAEKKIKEERASAVAEAEKIIGESKFESIGTYSWRGYLLRMYMLGREAGREPEKPGGVWQIATRERWDFRDLMNVVTLEAINKAIGIGFHPSALISGGEWSEWFKAEQGNYRTWAQERTRQKGSSSWDDYIDSQMEEKKTEFRELVLEGAITRDFQFRGRIAAADWGMWMPGIFGKARLPYDFSSGDETKGKHNITKRIPNTLRDARFTIDLKRVQNKVEAWAKENIAV